MNSRPVVLVTGASRGLGRGVAEELARAGMSVAVHYGSNQAAAEETLKVCDSLKIHPEQKFEMVKADLGKGTERNVLVEKTLEKLGRLDALVNNAGIAPRIRADVTEATEEIFDEVLNVNLKGPHFITQKAVQYWLKNPGSSLLKGGYKLVFVTSISAFAASINRAEYCVSKAGLSMAGQVWASRLAGEGIQVVEYRPGIMATDMTSGVKQKYDDLIGNGLIPQKRWGTPSDVGLAVRSFLEGSFPFSTGEIINLDGGFHLQRL